MRLNLRLTNDKRLAVHVVIKLQRYTRYLGVIGLRFYTLTDKDMN